MYFSIKESTLLYAGDTVKITATPADEATIVMLKLFQHSTMYL
ncbi:MAG: hypothetical protein ACI4ES_16045 [Roseburia sp.]